MGRTRPKSRKAHPAPAASASTAENASPSVPALLEKAQSLIVQCDYELAGRFVKRILQREPRNAVAKEMLGVIQLEIGELLDAKKVRLPRLFGYHSPHRRHLRPSSPWSLLTRMHPTLPLLPPTYI